MRERPRLTALVDDAAAASDARLAGGAGGRPARRRIAVTAMVSGALPGAVLVTNVELVLPLATAALLAASAVAAARLDRG